MPVLDHTVFNTFEGGTDGVAISEENSGNPSGDAFEDVQAGADGTLTYSSTQARNSLSMRAEQGATGSVKRIVWTDFGAITTAVYVRFYMWIPALPSVNVELVRFSTVAGTGTQSAALQLTSAGVIRFTNASNNTIAASTGTVSPATSQWVRIEARVVSSTTVGEVSWRLFNTHSSTTASETGGATGQVLGADTERVSIGMSNAFPTSVSWYFDNLGVSPTDWLGVAVLAPANTALPEVSGFPVVGDTLTATNGTWIGDPTIVYTYQWTRDGVSIGGATSSTYTLVDADEGTAVLCAVTATNAGGAVEAESGAVTVLGPEDVFVMVDDAWTVSNRKVRVSGAWVS